MKNIHIFVFVIFSCWVQAQEKEITIVNSSVNSKVSDFGLTYFGDDGVVFASTRREPSIDKRIWKTNRQPYLELFKGKLDTEGEIINVEKFSSAINTKYHESNLIFTKDLKTVYFTRNNYLNNKFKRDNHGWNLNQLYKAEIGANGDWSNIQALPFNSDQYQTGHPALNKNEDKLFFISDMPGTLGLTDIFVVDIFEDGSYSEPRSLGPTVNTKGKEMFPFVDNENRLYYATDGWENKEDLDLYVISNFTEGGNEQPSKLASPFNSESDDFGFIYNENSNTGYFSSNRKGGKGDDDIYYFSGYRAPKLICDQDIQIFVRNKETKNLMSDVKLSILMGQETIPNNFNTDSKGSVTLTLECNSSLQITAKKEFFEPFTTVEQLGNTHLEQRKIIIELAPNEFVNKNGLIMVNIAPIYFDLDKSIIRPDAAIELEKVYQILLKYPSLKIDLGSHTDSRARDQYNLDLSNRRVKSSIDWLIGRGIAPNRLSGKGYGESQLVNKCKNGVKCTDAEHQQNRRTEFIIINPEVLK